MHLVWGKKGGAKKGLCFAVFLYVSFFKIRKINFQRKVRAIKKVLVILLRVTNNERDSKHFFNLCQFFV